MIYCRAVVLHYFYLNVPNKLVSLGIVALPPAVHSPAAFQLAPDYHLNSTTGNLVTDLCNGLNYVFITWMGKKIGALRQQSPTTM